jgi:hypothetical protein
MATEVVTKILFFVKDRLVVSDPCYIDSDDVDSSIPLDEVLSELGQVFEHCAGEWEAEINTIDEHVSVLYANKVGENFSSVAWEHVGKAGVDSGQMFLGCASMFGLDYDALLEKYKGGPEGEWIDRSFFAFGEGAVSGTGWGDGVYPISVRRDQKGNVVEVKIEFFEDEEDEDTHAEECEAEW